MLEARLKKKRDHFVVEVDFSCPDGKLLTLTGPSGSGKTTIIRTLAGLEKPDSGRIQYGKRLWYDSSKNHFLNARFRRVGYVFQEHTLFPHLTVRENVSFACKDKEHVTALLETLRISHLAKSMPHQISGGEKQRAALAQALASGPDVLFLDEPFSALDTHTRLRLRQELSHLKRQLSIPIVMVTHDLEEARQLGDINICLNRGVVEPCEERLKSTPSLTLSPA